AYIFPILNSGYGTVFDYLCADTQYKSWFFKSTTMKKTIFIILTIFAVFLIILVAVPFIFKDKILERIDKEIAGAVNAQVYYDYNNISLSVFKNFPSISA